MIKTKLTIKAIALCLGERLGEDVSPRQIRVRGNWLFYRDPDYSEIECYWAKDCQFTGVMSSEPWHHIRKEDSPFVYHNQDIVFNTCKKLDHEYKNYSKEIK